MKDKAGCYGNIPIPSRSMQMVEFPGMVFGLQGLQVIEFSDFIFNHGIGLDAGIMNVGLILRSFQQSDESVQTRTKSDFKDRKAWPVQFMIVRF